MDDTTKYQPSQEFAAQAHVGSLEQYQQLYQQALEKPEEFWGAVAEQEIHWFQKWNHVFEWQPPFVKWFVGAKSNVSYNCLDRHLTTWRKNKAAIIWEGEPGDQQVLTYQELYRRVCRFANVLKGLGLKAGDTSIIYMPMVPELPIAMLACARLGIAHSVVFGGFSSEALKSRIQDLEAKVVITADGGWRRGKEVRLKPAADEALVDCPAVQNVVVFRRTGGEVHMQAGRDHWWHELEQNAADTCDAEPLDSETPLFVLYTSGTTGQPKGIVHTTGGYMVQVAVTMKWVFDLKDEDTYWCAADVGWVTGHSYIVYGPLCNGAITMMFEGVPNYPSPSRFWEVIDKHKVNIFYTAPTAIRALMREGEAPVTKTSRASLKLLGTVGEPINPEAWEWYYRVVGDGKRPIVDTWWQTETGGILITPLPGATKLKPGSATRPFFGVVPAIVDPDGKELQGECSGNLVITRPWPGMMRSVYGDHQRFVDTYFKNYAGKYFTGDGARRDKDGYYWITGRVDDVLNVAGHRLGTAEVESALVLHHAVAEAAVVGFPHAIKGQGIYCYVTLKVGVQPSEELRKELVQQVRKEIGATATPDVIQWAPGLPKTRSGKIMRRILRKIAENELGNLGDISTLADPAVVDDLVKNRAAK